MQKELKDILERCSNEIKRMIIVLKPLQPVEVETHERIDTFMLLTKRTLDMIDKALELCDRGKTIPAAVIGTVAVDSLDNPIKYVRDCLKEEGRKDFVEQHIYPFIKAIHEVKYESLMFQHPKVRYDFLINEPGKILRCRILYGAETISGDASYSLLFDPWFQEGIDASYSAPVIADKIERKIEFINKKVEQAVRRAFLSPSFERMLGAGFSKNVQIYISREKSVASVPWIQKKYPSEIEFHYPTSDDIRFTIGLWSVVQFPVEEIASAILHEVTHIVDEKSDSNIRGRPRNAFTDAPKFIELIRDEGLACFHQFVDQPDSLTRQPLPRPKKIQYTTLNELGGAWKEIKHFEYIFGTHLMFQIFATVIKRPQDVDDVAALAQDFKDFQKAAITLIQMVRKLDSRKFFAYYKRIVKDKLLSDELLDVIIATPLH